LFLNLLLPCHLTSVDSRKNVLHCASENRNGVGKDVNVTAEMTWDIKSAPKLDFDEDYYSVLEVDSKIVPKDLKKAYYSIVFIYHPDRKSEVADKELANKQMMVINGKVIIYVVNSFFIPSRKNMSRLIEEYSALYILLLVIDFNSAHIQCMIPLQT
jgi:DnaJ domain